MLCSCRTSAFRLFVRSFGQLQLGDHLPSAAPASSIARSSSRGLESFRRARGVGRLHRRLYSTAPQPTEEASVSSPILEVSEQGATKSLRRGEGVEPPRHEVATEQRQHEGGPGLQQREEVAVVSKGAGAEQHHNSSPIAELTPESIAALAAELESLRAITPPNDASEPAGDIPTATASGPEDPSTSAAPPAKKVKLRWRNNPELAERGALRRAMRAEKKALAQLEQSAAEVVTAGVAKRDHGPSSSSSQERRGRERRSGAPKTETWQIQKDALREKFGREGWQPRKRLSPDALTGIRALNAQYPAVYTTEALAKRFEVSPEAIRRILKSKWAPSAEEEENRERRWFKRGVDIWSRWAELGRKPPRTWRDLGIVPMRKAKVSKERRTPTIRGVPRRPSHVGTEGPWV